MDVWDFHFLGNTAFDMKEVGLSAQWLAKAYQANSAGPTGITNLLARLAHCHFIVRNEPFTF